MQLDPALQRKERTSHGDFSPPRGRRSVLRTWLALAAFCGIATVFSAGVAQAQTKLPAVLEGVGLDQKLGESIPLDLSFRDESGKAVKLRDYFGERPVILTLAYYECPMLCTQVLNSLTQSVREISFEAGKQYSMVTVSINPRETSKLAAAKKKMYQHMYGRPMAEAGWHFLTGDEDSIQKLAAAVGFRYKYDAATGQYAHASGIMVLTPEGQLSRYFYGIDYPPRDLRLSLVEASAGKVGSAVDQLLLFCYHYDPMTGKYGLVIMNVIRAAGLATVLLIGSLIFVLSRNERTAT